MTTSPVWESLHNNQNQSLSTPELTLTEGQDYSLLTDLYQLTMAACYVGEGVEQLQASFELFARQLPKGFGYAIAMGLAQALEYLEKFCFSPSGLAALKATGIFENAPERFWSILAEAKFTGDVWAVPEGTAVFANEPILRVEAPLWQAQLVETYLLNTINYQTLIATKAARLRDVAGVEATILEFGTRRAFSPQASLWAARAALAGGLDATSNVLAALKLGQQPSGTMAHALVMALSAMEGSEEHAFTAFHRYFPGASLLIDTYDTVAAAELLAEKVNAGEMQLSGVRLDSGDLVELSQKVRSLLPNTSIFASGDLDEWEITRLKTHGACIDGYGVGTKLVTGAPINGVYKLVEIDGIPVMKNSKGKVTYPGRKQIWRSHQGGMVQRDELGLVGEERSGQPLLQLVVKEGQRVQLPDLAEIRERTAATVASLPLECRDISTPIGCEVRVSPKLHQLQREVEMRNEPRQQSTGAGVRHVHEVQVQRLGREK